MAECSDVVGSSHSSLTDLRVFYDRSQSTDALARRLGRLLVRKCPTQNHDLIAEQNNQQHRTTVTIYHSSSSSVIGSDVRPWPPQDGFVLGIAVHLVCYLPAFESTTGTSRFTYCVRLRICHIL